jgi:sec-independent protein translocase protein TatB
MHDVRYQLGRASSHWLVALVVIGPKELPGVLRTLGQWTGKLRRMASEFQAQFQEAMREAEMADLKKQVEAPVDASAASDEPSIGSNAEASAGAPTMAPKDSQPAEGSPDAQDGKAARMTHEDIEATKAPLMEHLIERARA